MAAFMAVLMMMSAGLFCAIRHRDGRLGPAGVRSIHFRGDRIKQPWRRAVRGGRWAPS